MQSRSKSVVQWQLASLSRSRFSRVARPSKSKVSSAYQRESPPSAERGRLRKLFSKKQKFIFCRLEVRFDDERIMQASVDEGVYRFRPFDTLPEDMKLGADITMNSCSGKAAENGEECTLPTDGSVENFEYSIELSGLTIEDSKKTIGLEWNCASEVLDVETALEVWQQGEIEQIVNATDLSSDMDATLVASCSVTGELPKVEQITFNIGDFEQDVTVDENGLAQLNVTGADIIRFGGANVHARAIECSATQFAVCTSKI